MKKTLYCLVIIAISLPVMIYGMKAEQDSLLINGFAVLEIIVPTFTFVLTQLFILLFDKEDHPIIIIATSLLINVLGYLITIGYYNIDMSALSGKQGILNLMLFAILVAMFNMISLRLYAHSATIFTHHPKQ